MPTRKIVPRANGEGAIGDNTTGAEKFWGGGYFLDLNGADAVEMASWNDSLQWKASTSYVSGDIVFTSGLKAGQYLECTTDGISGSAKPTIPASVVPNTTTITDNTVIWTVREISSTQIDDSYSRKPSTIYQSGDIRFLYSVLPVGWFLECSTAGTTDSGDLTITTPTERDTVTDGTVVWTIKKMGSGNGDGFAVGDIKQIAHNGTIQDGWLECDGRAVSRTMFADLFDAIGTTYGAGDGSTTFNLPNYSDGKFPEGSTVAGTVKQAGLPNITGETNWEFFGRNDDNYVYKKGAFGVNLSGIPKASTVSGSNAYSLGFPLTIDASLSNPIYGNSNTVQPYSLTTRYIIKAYDGVTPTPAEADISEILTELTGKADRQLSNLDKANLACHVVVDSYYDSTTGDWWREYDDGWIEQGGIVNNNPSTTINLLKPYANTKYTLQLDVDYAADLNGTGHSQIAQKTTTSFRSTITQAGQLPTTLPAGNYYNWVAYGMGANS